MWNRLGATATWPQNGKPQKVTEQGLSSPEVHSTDK